ncbi:NAD/NADP-dependent octopine/nopaline dehydrogenase family protein [soil metagenome]
MSRITVLGGGNTAFSMAAKLTLEGHEVLLWEHPDFANNIAPIQDSLAIELIGAEHSGLAKLACVTTDAAEALEWAEVLLCSVPSYAHQAFADQLIPHLQSRHLLILLPGNLGSLTFVRQIRESGRSDVVIAESDTAPYVCRKTGPAQATIWGTVSRLGIGVFPASQTAEVVAELEPLFPGVKAYEHVLTAGLSAMNPVVHPPGILLNAGRIERSRGEFWFYDEGVTPSVAKVIEALDRERLAIGQALGLVLSPASVGFHEAGFGPSGDLWSVINGSRMLTALRAPGSLETRWLTEDVPFGLATWSDIAESVGVDTPIIDGTIELASALVGCDFRSQRRTLEDLGIHGLQRQVLIAYLQ